jgi:hypothetical protein
MTKHRSQIPLDDLLVAMETAEDKAKVATAAAREATKALHAEVQAAREVLRQARETEATLRDRLNTDELFLTWQKLVDELVRPKLGEFVQGHFDTAVADINEISADYRKKIALVVGNINGSYEELRRAMLIAIKSVRDGKIPPPIVMLSKGKPVDTSGCLSDITPRTSPRTRE